MTTRVEIDRQDLYTFVGSLTRRLRLFGQSLISLYQLGTVTDSEVGVDELGVLLVQDAGRLKAARDLLCDKCRLLEVIDSFEIRKGRGRHK